MTEQNKEAKDSKIKDIPQELNNSEMKQVQGGEVTHTGTKVKPGKKPTRI
jgi:bacteriocin-like protein